MLVVYFIHNFSRHYTATACAYSCQHHLWRHAGVGEFGEKGAMAFVGRKEIFTENRNNVYINLP